MAIGPFLLAAIGGQGGVVIPGAPGTLSLSAGDPVYTAIALSWSAPSEDGGAAISGYKIERSTNSGSSWSDLVADTGSTGTSYNNTGLTANTRYDYRVSAINEAGAGAVSNAPNHTTTAYAVPGAPGTLSLAAGSPVYTAINLSWSAPSSTGGQAITGYKIEISTNSGGSWSTEVADTSSTGTTYSDSSLTANTRYDYRVSAINSVGTGTVGNAPYHTTTANSAPGAPGTLSLSNGSPAHTAMTLSWSAPSDTGGLSISGYRIKQGGSVIVSNTGSSSTSYHKTGLSESTSYNFTVAAINSVGTGSDGNTPSRSTGSNPYVQWTYTGSSTTGTSGGYSYIRFLTAGTFTVTSNPNSRTFDEYYVAGGGGGLGYHEGAGAGGGGGSIQHDSQTRSTNTGYSVSIGGGGAQLNVAYSGLGTTGRGGSSKIGSNSHAVGGGPTGGTGTGSSQRWGGCGGGGTGRSGSNSNQGGPGSQGYDGGDGVYYAWGAPTNCGGGGGGGGDEGSKNPSYLSDGGTGGNQYYRRYGNGGIGKSSMMGRNHSGGGGASGRYPTNQMFWCFGGCSPNDDGVGSEAAAGTSGSYGAGNGSKSHLYAAGSGDANRGGGGGGHYNYFGGSYANLNGGAGGSGFVEIRWTT